MIPVSARVIVALIGCSVSGDVTVTVIAALKQNYRYNNTFYKYPQDKKSFSLNNLNIVYFDL